MKRFKIIGMGNSRDNFTPNKDYTDPKKVLKNGKMLNGNAINCVLAIKRNTKPGGHIIPVKRFVSWKHHTQEYY